MSETVIDIKTKKRRQHAPRDLVAIDKTSGPARYYAKMMRDIENDLGGRRNLSRIQTEWIKGFCGCATRLEYLNYQIMLGEACDCDVAGYAQLASTMLRLGSKLSLSQSGARAERPKAKSAYLEHFEQEQKIDNERNAKKREAFEAKQREDHAAWAAERAASAPAAEDDDVG